MSLMTKNNRNDVSSLPFINFLLFIDWWFKWIMSSIKVIFQKLPASERDFQEKLKSVSDSGSSDLHDRSALNEIQRLKIKQVSKIFDWKDEVLHL